MLVVAFNPIDVLLYIMVGAFMISMSVNLLIKPTLWFDISRAIIGTLLISFSVYEKLFLTTIVFILITVSIIILIVYGKVKNKY